MVTFNSNGPASRQRDESDRVSARNLSEPIKIDPNADVRSPGTIAADDRVVSSSELVLKLDHMIRHSLLPKDGTSAIAEHLLFQQTFGQSLGANLANDYLIRVYQLGSHVAWYLVPPDCVTIDDATSRAAGLEDKLARIFEPALAAAIASNARSSIGEFVESRVRDREGEGERRRAAKETADALGLSMTGDEVCAAFLDASGRGDIPAPVAALALVISNRIGAWTLHTDGRPLSADVCGRLIHGAWQAIREGFEYDPYSGDLIASRSSIAGPRRNHETRRAAREGFAETLPKIVAADYANGVLISLGHAEAEFADRQE